MTTLLFVFRGGSTVEADRVSEWEVGGGNGKIESLTVKQDKSATKRIIVQSINLDSIDCILEVNERCF